MADQRQSLRRICGHYCKWTLTLAVAAGVVAMLAGEQPLGRGLILGALGSTANFTIMTLFIPLRLTRPGRRRTLVLCGAYVLRYTLLSLPLILAYYLSERFSFIGAAIGVFTVQIVILAEAVLKHRRYLLEAD